MAAQSGNSAAQARLDTRLGELEAITTRITVESKNTRQDIEKLTASFDRFAGEVTGWMRVSGRPNVGWLLGGASLVITVLTLAATPLIHDLQRVEAAVQELEKEHDALLQKLQQRELERITNQTSFSVRIQNLERAASIANQ